jgi:hypothetical protein
MVGPFRVQTPVGVRFSAPVQTGPETLYNAYQVSFPKVNCPERGVDYSPPSSADVKHEWSYTSTPPLHPEIFIFMFSIM